MRSANAGVQTSSASWWRAARSAAVGFTVTEWPAMSGSGASLYLHRADKVTICIWIFVVALGSIVFP